jgi:acyl-CoA synthetase (AMP-forming)/AMP-acid ligase II
MNLVQTLRQRSDLQPGVPALVEPSLSGDRRLTYSGLNRLVDYLSFELREKDLQCGDRILFAIPPSQEMYGYLLAALQIGAIPILCDCISRGDEFASWMDVLEPKGCIVGRRWWIDGAFKSIPTKICVGRVRSEGRWLRLGKMGAVEECAGDSLALIFLVQEASNHVSFRVWSQEQLQESIQLLISQLKLKAGEVDLCASSLHLLANLAAGLTSMIAARFGRSLSRQVEKFKPTRVAAGSSVVRHLLSKPVSPLHKVFITDAPLEQNEVDYFSDCSQRANIELIFYGDLPLASISLNEYQRKDNAQLIGSFHSGVEARVSAYKEQGDLEEERNAVSVGESKGGVGQLLVRAPFLPHRRSLPEFLQDGLAAMRISGSGWRSTGVLGYFDEKSRFWITERMPGPTQRHPQNEMIDPGC